MEQTVIVQERTLTRPAERSSGPVSRGRSQETTARKVIAKLKRSSEALDRFRGAAKRTEQSLFARLVEDGYARHVTPVFATMRGTSRAPSAVVLEVVEEAVRLDARSSRAVIRIELGEGTDGQDLARHLESMEAEVEYAFVPPVKRYLRPPPALAGPDPLLSRQWGHGAVGINVARSRPGFVEATGVRVAVVDSGIDEGHPDLQGGTIASYDIFISKEDKRDIVGHGTHVAGIIAAQINNAVGVAGLCQASIVVVKGLPHPDAVYDPDEYYRALAHAIDSGALVLNLSLGGMFDPVEKGLIDEARKADVLVVAAMGNDFQKGNPIEYPAAYPGVIAVGACDELDRRAGFSSTGGHIALVAPGVRILSTVPTYPTYFTEATHYDAWPGTSMATPFVAAAAALLRAKDPSLTAPQVADRLRASADPVATAAHLPNDEYGAGRLNIAQALV